MLSPSASVAVTVPMVVWFSSAVNELFEVITGLLSFRLLMFTVISWDAVLAPSETVINAE